MGLDMYLVEEIFIGGEYDHRNVTGEIKRDDRRDIPAKEISSIECSRGYWRKANHIHKWFVDNVQDGEDDCRSYEVEREQLERLRDVCKLVLETENSDLLPPQGGFFFGGTDVDEYYYNDLRETIKIIDSALEVAEEYPTFKYQASW